MPERKLTNLEQVISHQLLTPITSANVWHILDNLSSAGCTLFHRRKIEVIECSPHDYQDCDEDGIADCLMNTPVTINTLTKVCNVLQVTSDGHQITCRSLKDKTKLYAGFIEETHRTLRLNLHLNITDLFIEQGSVHWLVTTFKTARTEAKKVKPATGVQEERFKALEYYLRARNFEKLGPSLTLQSMYENIGAPYKDELWAQLQKIDSQFFASGYDDFFKLPYFQDGNPSFKLKVKVKQGGRPAKK
jgi:hypothetical protein